MELYSLPFMLALVTNDALNGAIRIEDTEQNLRTFNSIVIMMTFLEEKDRYLYYLSQHMCKRLLDQDLASLNSLEWERQLIHIIKSRVGAEFSKNLEAMVVDVHTSYEKKEALNLYLSQHSADKLIKELSVSVLANCEWLLPCALELSPPPTMAQVQTAFEAYYTADPLNANKRLDWNYGLGLVELRYCCQGRDYTLLCKPYQYVLLAQFELTTAIAFQDLASLAGFKERRELCLVLESLVAKPGVLLRCGEGIGEYSDTDVFRLNPEFRPKAKRVALKEAKFEDRLKAKNAVDNERVHAIQGAIMKVMKNSKVVEYGELCRLVEKMMLKFSPSSKAIRKEVDDLMKKEFLERDPDNFNRLRYVA